MASPDFHSIWLCSSSDSLYRSFNVGIVEVTPTRSNVLPVLEAPIPLFSSNKQIPDPPLLPGKTCNRSKHPKESWNSCFVPKENRDIWDRLFKDGIGADVLVITDDMSRIPAHSSVLVAVSPVLWNLVQQSKVRNGMRHIKLPGVPYDVAYAFLRFLYSSCYDEEFLKKFVLHFLVLSHSYSVPSLKRICVHTLENGWLTKENVIDVLQLARNCDAPRLSSICVSMVIKDLKTISSTDGWRVMRSSNPSLEQELVEAAVEADTRRHEKAPKMEEKKVYMQLNEAMEALIHICKDGCRTIGPHDKALKGSQDYCKFPACKGLETLVRHFSNCKIRVPGGCVHCKRMWQILELHSRMCHDLDSCKVPLCGRFKEKMQQQSKKDEVKWRMLVNKVAAAKPLKPFYSSGRSG